MKGKTKDFGPGAKTGYKQKSIPRPMAKPEAGPPRHVSRPLAPQLKASTSGGVPQGQRPLAYTPATINVRSESAAANTSGEPGANSYSMKNDALAEIKFRRCDAALRKIDSGGWDLADAIVAECSETGDNGVRNESYALMNAMRQEIAANHGVELSFERVRKLRQAASVFPPGRRRPGVSIEGHLEAGTLEALDAFIKGAPNGTPLTCSYIRRLKHPTERVEQDQQKAERRHQKEDQTRAWQDLCRQQERQMEKVVREKAERERRYTALCRSIGKDPEPFSPLLSDDEPPLSVAEDLEQGLRVLLTVRGFDPAALKKAIADFVDSVLAQQQ
jgi:hypothetical protein